MQSRRHFIRWSAFSLPFLATIQKAFATSNRPFSLGNKPIVVSTWDSGLPVNKVAWEVLKKNGRALDARVLTWVEMKNEF